MKHQDPKDVPNLMLCFSKKEKKKPGERMCCGPLSLRNAALSSPFWKLTKYIRIIKALRNTAKKESDGPFFNLAIFYKRSTWQILTSHQTSSVEHILGNLILEQCLLQGQIID